MFHSEGLTDTLDINSSVKIVRELGFSTSHPSTMTSGCAATCTYDDLVDILNSARTEGILPDATVHDAETILKVTHQLQTLLALGGDIFWIRQCDW